MKFSGCCRILILSGFGFLVTGCDDSTAPQGKVLSRITRPGGSAVAMVTEINYGGATVGIAYRVYIQGTGAHAKTGQTLNLYRSEIPTIAWRQRRTPDTFALW